eukprot:s946_g9.t1
MLLLKWKPLRTSIACPKWRVENGQMRFALWDDSHADLYACECCGGDSALLFPALGDVGFGVLASWAGLGEHIRILRSTSERRQNEASRGLTSFLNPKEKVSITAEPRPKLPIALLLLLLLLQLLLLLLLLPRRLLPLLLLRQLPAACCCCCCLLPLASCWLPAAAAAAAACCCRLAFASCLLPAAAAAACCCRLAFASCLLPAAAAAAAAACYLLPAACCLRLLLLLLQPLFPNALPLAGCVDVSEKPVTHLKLTPPPHNGVGREEDSLINCSMIQPKPPKVDLEKLMLYTGEVMRFECEMVNGEPEDEMRRLVIAYYLADDEVAVFEEPVRNSGHMGGRFSEKRRIKNPATGEYFKLSDLFVGQTVVIAAQPLRITRADEHCLQYLEAHPEEFPYASPVACARRILPLAAEPEMQDEKGVEPDRLKDLAAAAGVYLVDHEVVTLLRHFGARGMQSAFCDVPLGQGYVSPDLQMTR